MRLLKSLFSRLRRLRAFQPISIVTPPPGPPSLTDRLIILRVDFPIDAPKAVELDAMLLPIREKYGLDFIVLEPGMTLSRFNDI